MENLFELGSNLMIILQTLLQTLFLSDATHRLEMNQIFTFYTEIIFASIQVRLHLRATEKKAWKAGCELPPCGEHHPLDCQYHPHQPDRPGRNRGGLVLVHSHQVVTPTLHPLQVKIDRVDSRGFVLYLILPKKFNRWHKNVNQTWRSTMSSPRTVFFLDLVQLRKTQLMCKTNIFGWTHQFILNM